jgi:hypothetical protein
VSSAGEFHPDALSGRVEDWRGVPKVEPILFAPRFLWECLTSLTVNPFPTPATSNPACGFPALGFPVGFLPEFMGPILLVGLSAPADAPGMH